ncbi:hypothetical protein O181_095443 [Austropuccinia psidii MF-1]|uniref:Uncharacterized protein n=1 Tax=Austropuccinia psidii MF-1 TaxID=1389203 RepID=A0A9Q3J3U5_9BASI|nr:hypothetical protein [Austropuccinia psidii MF-1]
MQSLNKNGATTTGKEAGRSTTPKEQARINNLNGVITRPWALRTALLTIYFDSIGGISPVRCYCGMLRSPKTQETRFISRTPWHVKTKKNKSCETTKWLPAVKPQHKIPQVPHHQLR